MVSSYPEQGSENRVQSKHQATQHYAGDVLDRSSEFRNIQESNRISRELKNPKPKEIAPKWGDRWQDRVEDFITDW